MTIDMLKAYLIRIDIQSEEDLHLINSVSSPVGYLIAYIRRQTIKKVVRDIWALTEMSD